MKKYLLAALLTTCSLTALASTSCPKGQDQLLIASQKICGTVVASKEATSAAVTLSITMNAGPHSPLYEMHKHKFPGIFKDYVKSLKSSTIPAGVAHAIDTVNFTNAKENNALYAGKTYTCGTPSISGVKNGDIKHAMLTLPSCVVATPA